MEEDEIDKKLNEIVKSLHLSHTNQILATSTENYIITNVKLDAIIKTLSVILGKIDDKDPAVIESDLRKDFQKEIDERLNNDHIIRQLYPGGL